MRTTCFRPAGIINSKEQVSGSVSAGSVSADSIPLLGVPPMDDNLGPILLMVVYIGVVILTLAGTWKAFAKAGEPGWACIVPIYNIVVMCRMAGKPAWWVLLFFVPF